MPASDECQYELLSDGRARCTHCAHTRPLPPGLTTAQLHRHCPRSAAARPVTRRGPGAVLHDVLTALGLTEKSGCGCRALSKKMDAWGVAGCQANRAEILEKLRAAAKEVPWRKLLAAAGRAAIRREWLNPLDAAGSLLDGALRRAAAPLDLVFNLPPGIGDCSWVYSKIAGLAEKRAVGVRVSKSGLPRALDFVQLLPSIDCLGWGEPFDHRRAFVSPDTDLASLEPGEYHLFANDHLEAGGKLADLWPRQETRYHYPLNTTPAMAARAGQILGSDPIVSASEERAGLTPSGPLIGFYCSSGRRDCYYQNLWRVPEWLEMLTGIAAAVRAGLPTARPTFVAIGANYDLRTPAVAKALRAGGHRVLECIGTHLGVAIETIKRLDYFVAYPSGLGILGDVVDAPTLMFYWPNFHDAFLDTYADPINVATGRHLNRLFCPPREALDFYRDAGGLKHTLLRHRRRVCNVCNG